MGRRLARCDARWANSSGHTVAHCARVGRGNRARICADAMRAGQKGVAIVLAMGVVALAAMAAAAIIVSQGTWSRQNELTSDHVQAQALVNAGVDWARAVLSDDRRSSSVDHLG